MSKDIIKKMKENLENWRKLYTNYVSDKVSVSRTYKENLLINNKKTNYSIQEERDLSIYLPKGDMGMPKKNNEKIQ